MTGTGEDTSGSVSPEWRRFIDALSEAATRLSALPAVARMIEQERRAAEVRFILDELDARAQRQAVIRESARDFRRAVARHRC